MFKNIITKKIGLVLFLILFIVPIRSVLAQVPNVGFMPSNIWYSKDPFGEGDKIKIYTLVFNPDQKELSCAITFFDNTTLLGTKNIKVATTSVKDVSINWTVTAGDHTIFAKIENAEFLNSNGTYQEVSLAQNQSEESKRNVPEKIITNLPSNVADSIANSTSDVKQLITNNTPAFVSQAIDNTISSLEDTRTNVNTYLENNKEAVQKEIDALNKNDSNINKISSEETNVKTKLNDLENNNYVLKPFKYVELFFLNIFSYIFKYALIFYILLAIVLFLFLRFFWRLIF